MSYLKIVDNKIVEAPYSVVRNGKKIFGYNKENNEVMLFSDGYAKYEFPAYLYEIKNGVITKKDTSNNNVEEELYTKLEIRRALRAAGKESELDAILSGNTSFAKDWADAQEININDPLILTAVQQGYISQDLIDIVKGV